MLKRMSIKYNPIESLDWIYETMWLMPRPWGNCGCVKCTAWMIEDLKSAAELKADAIQILQHDLARWNVWLPYHYCECPDYCDRHPIYVDNEVKAYLTQKGVINWCPTTVFLYPIKTTGDGNCLPHAIALALWGVQDISMILRHLLYTTLVAVGSKLFRQRWKREKEWQNSNIPDGGLQYTAEEWEKEWSILVNAAEDLRREFDNEHPALPYESLEEMHVFVLSNILKRPIIILGEPDLKSPFAGYAIAQNNFIGIYLPLLWEPKECHPYPIVLCFLMNHFQPLVSRLPFYPKIWEWHPSNFIPLVTSSREMLRIHFLLEVEEASAHEILQKYLIIDEIPQSYNIDARNDILVARLAVPETCFKSKSLHEAPITPEEFAMISSKKEQLYSRNILPQLSEICKRSTAVLINNSKYIKLRKAEKIKMLSLCQSGSVRLTTPDDKWINSRCTCANCTRKQSNSSNRILNVLRLGVNLPSTNDKEVYIITDDIEEMSTNVQPSALSTNVQPTALSRNVQPSTLPTNVPSSVEPVLSLSSKNDIQFSNKTQIYDRCVSKCTKKLGEDIYQVSVSPTAALTPAYQNTLSNNSEDYGKYPGGSAEFTHDINNCVLCAHYIIFKTENVNSFCEVSGCNICQLIKQYKEIVKKSVEMYSGKSSCNSKLELNEGDSLCQAEHKCNDPQYFSYSQFLNILTGYSFISSSTKYLTVNCHHAGFQRGYCENCVIKQTFNLNLFNQYSAEDKQPKISREVHQKKETLRTVGSSNFDKICSKQKSVPATPVLKEYNSSSSDYFDSNFKIKQLQKKTGIKTSDQNGISSSKTKIDKPAGNQMRRMEKNDSMLLKDSNSSCIGPSCKNLGVRERGSLCETCYVELCVGRKPKSESNISSSNDHLLHLDLQDSSLEVRSHEVRSVSESKNNYNSCSTLDLDSPCSFTKQTQDDVLILAQ